MARSAQVPPDPLPESFIPQWMTRLCLCGHVDGAHDESCTGKLVTTANGEPESCPCTRFVRQPVAARSEVLSGPWEVHRRNRARVA